MTNRTMRLCRRGRLALVALACAALSTACTSRVPDLVARQPAEIEPLYPRRVEPDPLAEQFCDAVHGRPDRRKAQCCGTSAGTTLQSECVRTLSAALREGAVRIDGDDLALCLAQVEAQLDGCDWVKAAPPAPPSACVGILRGQREAGESCRSALECGRGLFCAGLGATRAGICTAPAASLALANACGGSPDALVTYARQAGDPSHPECAGFCVKGQCQPFVPVGGECLSNVQCMPGAHCAAHRCVAGPPPRIGESCVQTVCAAGAVCTNGRCTALKEAGEPCTSPFECRAACIKPAGSASGRCGAQCAAR